MSNNKKSDSRFAAATKTLSAALKKGASPTFRYHGNKNLADSIASRIARELPAFEFTLADCLSLIENHDYRLTANYLYAIKTVKNEVTRKYQKIIATRDSHKAGKSLYDLSFANFRQKTLPSATREVFFADGIDAVFNSKNRALTIYLRERRMKKGLERLVSDVQQQLGAFIEAQFDLPALNALVNQGVVKMWHLPDGMAVVSKRNNPKKPGKLYQEIANYDRISNQLKIPVALGSGLDSKNRGWLKITPPFAVVHDGANDFRYAFTKKIFGYTLEDLMLKEKRKSQRAVYITHYRKILDVLFERGILWGDMTPRNIIVERAGKDIYYNIFDFEKTRVTGENVALPDRIAHCRGQIFAEEFCIICPPEEVFEYFSDYFNPDGWDYDSPAAPWFELRPEVRDIILGRGIQNVTAGIYNQLDRDMLNARVPVANLAGTGKFPGQLNFKVEHYLSCAGFEDAADYERKTTEILIAAKKNSCYERVVNILKKAVDLLERGFVEAEFTNVLTGQLSDYDPPSDTAPILANLLDRLYEAGKSGSLRQFFIA